nr:glutathione S-transferase [Saccharina japonica]
MIFWANTQLEMGGDLAENFFPKWLPLIEKQLAATEGVYFGGKGMTVADIIMGYLLKVLKDGTMEGVPTTIVDPYPSLIALRDSIVGEPKIAAFIAKHAE